MCANIFAIRGQRHPDARKGNSPERFSIFVRERIDPKFFRSAIFAGPIKLFLASRLSGSEIIRARKPFRALVICNRPEGKICTEGRKDDNGSGGEFPSR